VLRSSSLIRAVSKRVEGRRSPTGRRLITAGAAITAAIGMTLAIRKLMFASFTSKFHRVGAGEIAHRPDPTIVVVTPSCIVEPA
jgi:hypothetical protein